MQTIFTAIINNNLERVKALIENKISTPDELEPSSFVGKEDNVVHREEPKTALELAESLGRHEIVGYLMSQKKVVVGNLG